MNGAHHRNRPSGGLIAALAVVLAVIAGLVIVACLNFAAGHWLTGMTALAAAALGGVAVFFMWLNQALLQLNRALIHQNARLLYVMKAEVPSDRTA